MYSLLRQKSSFLEQALIKFAFELVKTPSPSFSEQRAGEVVAHELQRRL